jgi:hypothetical protein
MIYGSNVLEFLRSHVEIYQTDVILALCAAVLLIFVLVWIALSRGRRLGKKIDDLTYSVNGLLNQEGARYTREILGRTKDKGLI